MPRRDGTGPLGYGPMMGRLRGNCFRFNSRRIFNSFISLISIVLTGCSYVIYRLINRSK